MLGLVVFTKAGEKVLENIGGYNALVSVIAISIPS